MFRLFKKSSLYQIILPENTYKIIISYLTDRTFKVKLKYELSATKKISAAIPKENRLGLILYLIDTLDMPRNPNTYTSTYTGDNFYVIADQNSTTVVPCL